MSKRYLVKLTPTGKFFFGGDMRFGTDGKDGDFSSYIIESSMLPQQTSLLGMMRFLLLSNNPDLFDIKDNCIKKDEKLYVLLDLALCKIYMIVCLISSIYRFCKCKKRNKKNQKVFVIQKIIFSFAPKCS